MPGFKKLLRSIFIPILLLIILFTLSSCGFTSKKASTKPDMNSLTVHYIDVGQADSILIQANGFNVLIDAGNRDDGSKVVSYLEEHGVEKLDYVIATHPHEDHIGGMTEVIKRIPIGKFYAPKKTENTKTFENMVTALQDKKLQIISAKAGISPLKLGDNAELSFLSPIAASYDDTNNYSAVVKLTYGEKSFLFMGDAEKLAEKQIINAGTNFKCDVLKVGHHGSSSSSSKDFLDIAKPSIAVISCGKNNDYGHPHKETLDEFKKRNVKVYRTDIDGTIVLTCDGKKISINK